MDIVDVFQNWDGKTVEALRRVANQVTPADYPVLLSACRQRDERVARAASWVLKAVYEAGGDPPYPADVLTGQPHWEVALHLLQSVQHCAVDLPAEIVAPYLDHAKPMVRAWALDAYIRLGPSDADSALQKAASDPAASVRARARNLTKKQ